MFHPSESIIITSKSKSGDSDSSLEKPRSIRGRQRASTWSSPSFKDEPPNSNSPHNRANTEKRKFRKRFGIHRKGSGNIGSMHVTSPTSTTAPLSQPPSLNQPQRKYLQKAGSHSNDSTFHHSSSNEKFKEENPEVTTTPSHSISGIPNDELIHWSSSSDLRGSDVDSPKVDSNSNINLSQDASGLENSDTSLGSGYIDGHITKDTNNIQNNDSPRLIPSTHPSSNDRLQNNNETLYPPNHTNISSGRIGSNDRLQNNNEPLYPSNHTNISSGRIGMWKHKDDNSDSKEEGENSFDYYDEHIHPSKTNNDIMVSTNTNSNVEDPNVDPLDRTLSEGSTNTSNVAVGIELLSISTNNKDDTDSYYDEAERSFHDNTNSALTQSLNIIKSDYCDSDQDSHSNPEHMQEWGYSSEGSTDKNRRCFNLPKPNWSRVATAVVRRAPCFWCCATVEISSTDRVILTKLNRLCTIFALYQVLCGASYCVVLLSQRVADRRTSADEQVNFYREALTPNLWMPSGSLLWIAIVGFFVFITMISSVRSIRRVNLHGALRYMWILYWILPFQVIAVLSFLDVQGVTDVWIKHWWSSRSMAGFRKILCEPKTMCECGAPASVLLNTTTTEDWCLANCNATVATCAKARTDATNLMSAYSYIAFISSSIVGLVLVALLMLALFLLQRIISEPIVKSSKESNIPLWLSFPTILSFLGGILLLNTPLTEQGTNAGEVATNVAMHETNHYLIGVFYVVSGSLFLGSAILGWFIKATTVLDGRDKTRKKIAVYLFIGMMVLTTFAVASILVYSLISSSRIIDADFSERERGMIACFYSAGRCTNCNLTDTKILDEDICPEWDVSDVLKIEKTIMKQSAAFASIFVIYAFTALRFGFILKTLVSRYEVDYV